MAAVRRVSLWIFRCNEFPEGYTIFPEGNKEVEARGAGASFPPSLPTARKRPNNQLAVATQRFVEDAGLSPDGNGQKMARFPAFS
jgi:hypothetical protein